MSWVATAVVAAAVIGGAMSNHQQKKAAGQQGRAIREAQEADAKEAAAAEVDSAVNANRSLAEKNRRRRISALAAGEPLGSTSVLGAPSAAPTAGVKRITSALGGGR